MSRRALLIVLAAAAATPARAQPDAVSAQPFDPARCVKPAAPAAATGNGAAEVPINWSELELTGTFSESAATVRALLAPTMERHHALTRGSRADIERSVNAFGYHVVGLGTREANGKTHAVLHVAPLPIVRTIDVKVNQSVWDKLFKAYFDDELRRRMRVRVGAYLPWSPVDRACELYEETQRIREFLQDEGYFEARATIEQKLIDNAIKLELAVELGPEYQVDVDRIAIPDAAALAVDAGAIRDRFRHRGTCLLPRFLCYGTPRFTRAQHQADLQRVVELFHAQGYPAVRVRSDFEPAQSIDRRTKKVRLAITIDQRRRLDVVFEGHNSSVSTEQLRKQLTFNQASSTDDVEASDSARAIAAYLQSRGYFDARVTWTRERFGVFDRLVYRIEQGGSRVVRSVGFVGNRVVSYGELVDAIGTKPARLSSTLLGANTAATSELLAGDVDRLVDLYRRRGYRDARVRVSASTDPAALDSAALTAGLLLANRGNGLHVRFVIDEGQPTLLTQLRVEVAAGKGEALATPEDRELCGQVLRELADLLGYAGFAKLPSGDRCVVDATDLPFREDVVASTADQLKDRLYSVGRPRAEVAYEPVADGTRRVAARFKLSNTQPLKIGKVVIRGNFRTRASIILGELRFKEGAPLTKDALAEGARRLRNTSLFDAVNIVMPDLDATSAGAVNAVVEVTERYDYGMLVEAEAGYSTFNGMFVRLIPTLRNLLGRGVSLEVGGTIGFSPSVLLDESEIELRQLALESTLRIPPWLPRRRIGLEFQTDITGFHRRQETPRFGQLRTTGFTVALSRTWERQRIGDRPARALTVGPHYDFRSRERNVDALRPIGADDDESQVPITTRTGSIGIAFEWEQRVDRRGNLSPLAPEAGFRFDAQVSYASELLFGQDEFIKASAAVSKYWPIGTNLVLRADLRYDQGFPLGSAALLPEVERFFAGGDATVRGYDDERLATEVVLVGVPPLDNVQQIRILPAGGNIRVIGSVDAQVRIYKLFASAVFFDAGLITNQWTTVTQDDIRPSLGMALVRVVTPFGAFALEHAVPLRPRLGDDPRGRWHISFAARAQF